MDKKKIARKIAEESIVLLKNADHILPLKEKKEITFFGRTQIGTLYSGNGSGGANIAGCGTILEECEKRGIKPESLLKEFYEYKASAEQVTEEDEFDWTKVSEMVNSGIMYEIFGKYKAPLDEYDVPETLIFQAAEKTDTAIFVIGRNSGGEECDRHLPEDYYLTRSEESLLKDICTHFANVVIVLNVNGLIDLSWVKKYASIKSLLFIGDYPSADHFSWDKEHLENILDYESYGLSSEENGSTGFTKSPVTVYWEDIYTGYRYFDTFGKQVLYPFGYGLSYTAFAISDALVKKQNGGILVTADVKNIGEMSGKEVIQIYLSKVYPAEGVERPYQELKGFEKTSDLAPGEKEQVKIWIPWRELAVYDEERAAWVIESGDYLLKMGNSSRDTFVKGLICVEKTILAEQCTNCLNITECNNGKIEFLTQKENDAEMASVLNITEQNKDVSGQNIIFVTPEDVHDVQENRKCGKETISKAETTVSEREKERNLAELSIKELAALCVGYGPGTPFAAVGDRSDPSTIFDDEGKPMTTNSHPTGYPGYVSPAIEEKGIKSVFYKDGPAGIGGVAWPTEMLIACSFDKKLWQMFGDAVGKECEEQQVNVWLAPAVNLHRNPLCGRNFEYFSEDPYLTGVCACEITKGVQNSRPVIVCPKHFAANEQETFRRGNAGKNVDAVDSILTERALREQYLKPFEMLVKDAGIACIMTSFNKINGSFSGGSHDLCTQILREEWGFEGAVVTDWGDMDMVVDGADAVAAGNDIVMPGGPPVIRQILKGYEEGRVTREELEQAVRHLLIMIKRIRLAD